MNGRPWIPEEDRSLRAIYPHIRTEDVARILGRDRSAIYARAGALGLEKSEAYHAAMNAECGSRLETSGAAHRFPKGHTPANKGLRRPGWHRGRMRETQFKKGHFPANRDPDFYVIGALRVNADGYVDMRVSFEPGALGWRALHRILWEDEHGPIPPGYCLRFIDGDKLNVCIENLQLISRADNARRNSIHNLPKPLKQTIQVLGQLKRRIREKQDRGSTQSPVRDARGTEGPGQAHGYRPREGRR